MGTDVVAQIRRATRKQFTAEEKIRIVLEGLRGETPISELCCRERIALTMYYRWRGRFRMGGREALHDRKPRRERNWNQLLPTERAQILEAALRYPGNPGAKGILEEGLEEIAG